MKKTINNCSTWIFSTVIIITLIFCVIGLVVLSYHMKIFNQIPDLNDMVKVPVCLNETLPTPGNMVTKELPKEIVIVPVYRCHIMCMIELYNTTSINPENDECCYAYTFLKFVDGVSNDMIKALPFVSGYTYKSNKTVLLQYTQTNQTMKFL